MHKLVQTKISSKSNLTQSTHIKFNHINLPIKKTQSKRFIIKNLPNVNTTYNNKKITRHNIRSNQFFHNRNSITNTKLQTKKSDIFIDWSFTTFSNTELLKLEILYRLSSTQFVIEFFFVCVVLCSVNLKNMYYVRVKLNSNYSNSYKYVMYYTSSISK